MRSAAALMYGIGALLLTIAAGMALSEMRWRRASVATEATVVAVRNARGAGGRAVYQFRVDSSQTVTAVERFAAKVAPRVGQRVTIRYLRAEPRRVEQENEMWWWNSTVVAAVALLWIYVVARNAHGKRGSQSSSVTPRVRKGRLP